ncbi:DUF2062 domain-containing protein [Marinibacterium sp. SX1]|uniref:DUF2062 domain-containing protein n=1 Tax=Marinibacterium sp. SX1 TaxID=3388424 RepID=UPI003D182869
MLRQAADFVYPPGGWGRAFLYVQHRVRRLPDKPERIARGIWAGVFTAFTPFYGLHFLIAALVARLMNGNILAALTGTFFGNPLTYVPIGAVSLETGHFLLGTRARHDTGRSFGGKFADAWGDLYHNFFALFTDARADWSGLTVFYHEIFVPYLVGGLLPGIICATVAYYLTVPVIRAYQSRRAARIRKKFDDIKANAAAAQERTADVRSDAR